MIKETLIHSNPWWSTGKIPEYVPIIKRDVFRLLKQELDKDRISAAVGPRRVGKSTLLYQIIDELLKNGVSAGNILYVSFDYTRGSIEEVIDNYLELMNPEGKIYCFFDEVHQVSDWSLTLKNYYDFKKNYKIFVSGSSSTLLYTTTESLVGRIWFVPVHPMSYREFLKIKCKKTVNFENITPSGEFLVAIDDLFEMEYEILKVKETLKRMLREYILWGGFPEYTQKAYLSEEWQNYLRQNFISLTLFKDVLSVYSVREPKALENLMYLIAEKQTLPLNNYTLSKILHIKKETVDNYLQYLKSAHLIFGATYYSKNATKRITKESKYYIVDTGLRNALLVESMLGDDTLGKDIEGAVAAHLMRHQPGIDAKLFYWKDKYEVDFVFNDIPIEIKFKNDVRLGELKGIIKFMEQFESKYGIVVTKDMFKMQDNIFFIPAWLFLAL